MTTAIKWLPCSGSTNGRGIKLSQTATAGNLLHTAQSATTDGCADLIEVTVYNSDTSDRRVTFEVGGTTAPDDNRGGTVPAQEERTFGPFLLRGGLALRAFASSANVLTVHPRFRQVVFS